MTEPREMILLMEAPIQEAKQLRDLLVEKAVPVALVRPEACGRKA